MTHAAHALYPDITIAAGPRAYRHIQENGLSPNDIDTVFGASGAAKWLTIAGLDSAVFGSFLARRTAHAPIDLYGTSVGAFKLAAAARAEPTKALATMAEAYIHQDYTDGVTHDVIAEETEKILTQVISAEHGGVDEILTNLDYHLHVGAVRCHGLMNAQSKLKLAAAMTLAGLGAVFTPSHLRGMAERVIFSDPRRHLVFHATDGFDVRQSQLSPDNLLDALKASGSIPVYMPGVYFADDPEHIYHDGGMLDYHPIPSAFWPTQQGLTLYPHFLDYFKIRWFDKFYKWRKARGAQLGNVVMIAPSPRFIASLPGGKIPDRQDIIKLRHHNQQRIDNWSHVNARSHDLGAQFIALAQSGDLAAVVEPL